MTFVMMTTCKDSPKCPSREALQITAMLAAQWTNAPPWLVIYACVSLEMPGTVSVIAFDFLLAFCFCYPPGIESCSSWFQSKLFHCWVEESGFHILRNAWPEIWNRAEKGCLNGAILLKFIHPENRFSYVLLVCGTMQSVYIFSRVVLVESWHPSKPLF